ncbi:hypothetical protein LWM68_43095 [Niabella sp. W65]|nr:hypothetical protein [Niabella sp. W65]MCH7368928.1 hypothetical protein [Niabella sp. W65]
MKTIQKSAPRLKKMLLELIHLKRAELAKYLANRTFDEELIRKKKESWTWKKPV